MKIEALYAKVGDKLIPVDRIENNVPILKGEAKETKHPDGRVDVTVSVPCLQIAGATKEV